MKRFLLLLLIILLWLPFSAEAATRLGLFHTQEELDIWRARRVSGPYKSAGDVSTNSPGDWDRIVSRKDAFLASPTNDRWAGQTTQACYDHDEPTSGNVPGQTEGFDIMSAAFWSLVMDYAGGDASGAATVRNAVRDQLRIQVDPTQTPGTVWTNSSRWCDPFGDGEGALRIAPWLKRLVFAYDYIRSDLNGTDQGNMDQWFLDAAQFIVQVPINFATARFPDRSTDDYTTNTGLGQDSICIEIYRVPNQSPPYVGCDFNEVWRNRTGHMMSFITSAAVLTNNATLKTEAKRWFKEGIKYYTSANNVFWEINRYRLYAADDRPQSAYLYTGATLGFYSQIADVLARNGDTELYEYETSEGVLLNTAQKDTRGGPKSLDRILTWYASLVCCNTTYWGTSTQSVANASDLTYRIDPVSEINGEHFVSDIALAIANNYYRIASMKSNYLRTASGAPGYPLNPNGVSPSYTNWGNPIASFPGTLFMFGQMADDQTAHPGLDPYNLGDPAPTVPFTASTPVASGTASTLTYGPVTNANTCTPSIVSGAADTNWTNTSSAALITGGSTNGTARTSATVYRLSCTGDGGTTPVDQTVTIIPTGGFTDNFNDNNQDTALWDINATIFGIPDPLVTVAETSNQLRITTRSGVDESRFNGYTTDDPYNLTGGYVSAEIVQVAAPTTTANTILAMAIDGNNGYNIAHEEGVLYFQSRIAGVVSSTTVSYVNATHRWWKIRHEPSGDLMKFETSTNGTAWTERRSIPRTLAVTAMFAEPIAGTYDIVGSTGVAIFDNFDLLAVNTDVDAPAAPTNLRVVGP